MLDIKRIAAQPEEFRQAMKNRGAVVDLDGLLALDNQRKAIIVEADALKARRNEVSSQIPKIVKQGGDVSELKAEMKRENENIKALDASLRDVEDKLQTIMLSIPNIPNESVPVGESDAQNVEIRKWGEPRKFDFEPLAHWDLGEKHNILDFATGAKITGARFTMYRGLGAKLERALTNFMLNTHAQHGYEENFVPFIVNADSMRGTGQLPKFSEDMFKLEDLPYYLIPTAEVPLTNQYRQSIIEQPLPRKHMAFSACFRAEAGAAGRDTRGIIRQHQFSKVELVHIAHPDHSYEALEELTSDAERILQLLGLPYRVVLLSTGDMGFCSAKTYDLEVWMPSYNRYMEISSCSNCEDFQARRASIRFREKGSKNKPQFAHTLNGSGVAVGRATAAVLENYQQADGSIRIPEILVPFMGVDRIG